MLSNAFSYMRATGYFSSSIYTLCHSEIIQLAKKRGTIRIICSPILSKEDIEAIKHGYDAKKLAENIVSEEIDELLGDLNHVVPVELLGTLIKLGVLEFKIATGKDPEKLFHEKTGVFVDDEDQCVSFKGSANETRSGWSNLGNHENIEVFKSWDPRDKHRTDNHKEYLSSLWFDEEPGVNVFDFPEYPLEKLVERARDSLDDFISKEFPNTKEFPVNLRNYQSEALKNWEMNGYKGILKHATGSGKTVTALKAIFDHVTQKKPALVLVPSKLLLDQWKREIDEKIPGSFVIQCGGGHSDWKSKNLINKSLKYYQDDGVVIIAVRDSAGSREFQKQIISPVNVLLIADEMHAFGTDHFRNFFEIDFGKRLGLSATPERYGDPVGTSLLLDYFGGILEPEVSLSDAIREKRLTKYQYYPELIYLTADEQERWEKLSRRIFFLTMKENKDPSEIKDLEQLFINRSRIAKKAEQKIPRVIDILVKDFEAGQHWLVYCEDTEQLEIIENELRAKSFKPFIYASALKSKEHELHGFVEKGGIMLSMRCLDEGVDIPIISHAIIASSSRNPRQFIQRRGRVLRLHSNKRISYIWDCLTVPLELDSTSFSGQIKKEIQRAVEFCADALNSTSASSSLRRIILALGENPEEYLEGVSEIEQELETYE